MDHPTDGLTMDLIRKHLPLWEQWAPQCAPVPYGTGCSGCGRNTGLAQDALLAMQTDAIQQGPVDVLVFVGQPMLAETQGPSIFTNALHRMVDRSVHKLLAESGESYRLAYAVKCRGVDTSGPEYKAALAACRPHGRWEMAVTQAKRVVALGGTAIRSLVGQWVDVARLDHAWTMVDGVPVFLLPDPAGLQTNRFNLARFHRLLKWALLEDIPKVPQGFTRVLRTGDEVREWLKALDLTKPTVVDTEHAGSLWSGEFRLLCLSLCQDPTAPVVLTPEAVAEARDALAAWCRSPKHLKVNQNIKHDRHALHRVLGVDMAGIASDTMLVSRLLEPESPAGLGPQSWLVGYGGYKEAAKAISTAESDKDGEETKGAAMFAKMPTDVLHAYNGRDGAATLLVHHLQQKILNRTRTTYDNLIGPAFDALAIVERNGMYLSESNVRAYDSLLEARERNASLQLHANPAVPKDFNPGSNQQLAKLLYQDLKLPIKGKTPKGAPSTAKDALEKIKDLHPIVAVLLELSVVRKQRSTYGLSLLEHISPVDGRVHTTFNLVRTLRLSSSSPNMQNVTTPEQEGDEGSWARGCFAAAPGHVLVNLDFCMAQGTLIDTPMGHVSIESLESGDMVFSYNHTIEKPDCSKVVEKRATGKKETLVVVLDNGNKIRCTPDHRFIALNGEEIRAGDLKPGQRLLPLRRGFAGPKKYETIYSHSAYRYKYTHQAVGWAKTGLEVVKEGMVIHHQDGDHLNNSPGNLLPCTRQEHALEHRDGVVAQWANPDVRLKMSEGISAAIKRRGGFSGEGNPNYGNLKGTNQVCAKCGVTFYRSPSRNGRFCSPSCYKESRNHTVTEVIRDGEVVPTYELEIGRDHNYALSAGVFVHNSQMELRVAAMLSGDKVMARAFSQGHDYHTMTAALIFSVKPEDVNKEQRKVSKTINFGLIYGQTAYGLSKTLGISETKAEGYIAQLFAKLTVLNAWRNQQIANAKIRGEVFAAWDPPGGNLGWAMRRSVSGIGDSTKEGEGLVKHNENVVLNTPIQSIANMFSLAALVEIVRWTQDEQPRAKVVMTVHDSIVLEVPHDLVEEAATTARGMMLQWPSGGVGLQVDVEVGPDWGHLQKWSGKNGKS